MLNVPMSNLMKMKKDKFVWFFAEHCNSKGVPFEIPSDFRREGGDELSSTSGSSEGADDLEEEAKTPNSQKSEEKGQTEEKFEGKEKSGKEKTQTEEKPQMKRKTHAEEKTQTGEKSRKGKTQTEDNPQLEESYMEDKPVTKEDIRSMEERKGPLKEAKHADHSKRKTASSGVPISKRPKREEAKHFFPHFVVVIFQLVVFFFLLTDRFLHYIDSRVPMHPITITKKWTSRIVDYFSNFLPSSATN